jgi:hypothetical protein
MAHKTQEWIVYQSSAFRYQMILSPRTRAIRYSTVAVLADLGMTSNPPRPMGQLHGPFVPNKTKGHFGYGCDPVLLGSTGQAQPWKSPPSVIEFQVPHPQELLGDPFLSHQFANTKQHFTV